MDGVEVCRRMRANKGGQPYIMILTAKSGKEDVVAGLQAGADDFLSKPYDQCELSARVRTASRLIELQDKLSEQVVELARYASKMELLAEERAKQLARADRMATLGILSAGIAHEINNPTTFISGNAQTMERAWEMVRERLEKSGAMAAGGDENFAVIVEEFPKMLAGVRKGVERVSKIVKGLKSYAHQEKGDKKPSCPRAVIEAALELCGNALKYKVTVEKRFSEPLPDILCNPQQVEQVLINLFVNAADAMGEQKKRGTLRIEVDSDGETVAIVVIDNGPGLPESILERIFDPFFTTKGEKGTGLGLAISKGIIEEHGGALEARNLDGKGAMFTIRLPAARSAPKEVNEENRK